MGGVRLGLEGGLAFLSEEGLSSSVLHKRWVYASHYILLPTMLLYFGILYPNNCGNLRRLHHSSLLLILLLHLPCPCVSFTLNSKLFF